MYAIRSYYALLGDVGCVLDLILDVAGAGVPVVEEAGEVDVEGGLVSDLHRGVAEGRNNFV